MLSQKRFKTIMHDKNLKPYIVRTHIFSRGLYLTLGLLKENEPIEILTCLMPYSVGVKIINDWKEV